MATVSAVINRSSYVSPALEKRVRTAIDVLNYSPNSLAQSLARQKTNTVGILIPDVANPFFPEIVRGAEDRAKRAGYMVLLGNSDNQVEKEELYLNLFLSKRVDGILLVKAPGSLSPAMFNKLRQNRPPLVLVDRDYPELKADTVLADDSGGAEMATRHLLELGHRRIGIITGVPYASTTQGRLRGYQQALASFGIGSDPQLILEGDYGIESGYIAGKTLLARKPTAVLVTNFLMTVGFLKAMKEQKLRCPQDVSIVSYDDFVWNDVFEPCLTSVEQPKYLLGCRSMEILLSRVQKRHKRPKFEVLPNSLRIRNSCRRV